MRKSSSTDIDSTKPADKFDKSAQYLLARRAHWDKVAQRRYHERSWGRFYRKRLSEIYRFLISPGLRVLELGCAEGDLLASVEPSVGFGVDFSTEMIERASQKHPELQFLCADVHELELEKKFDVIILSELLNDVWDVQAVFKRMHHLATPRTRIIINSFSHLWQIPLAVTRWLGLATPNLPQNWLTVDDTSNLLKITGFEVIKTWPEIIWPLPLGNFFNRYLARLWPFKHLCLTNFIVARPAARDRALTKEPTVSVIIPARNEQGHIDQIFERVPKMGRRTELIFIEGHSRDNTYEAIRRAIDQQPDRHAVLLKQTGEGKADAVRLGFAHARGDILIILDADLTVPPEDLPSFFDVLRNGIGEFVNGVRLVYPMEDQAMRYLNYVGNKFFSWAFTWLLGQPIKDTLCGTKALWKVDYERLRANRNYFGDFDPFGDYDLLLGAAKQNLRIVEVPIRYQERTYGTTNIQRWRHGLLLIKMVIFAARRLKFV